jgi:hypothetical protein
VSPAVRRQVRLQHDPDVVTAELGEQPVGEQPQRPLGVRGALHVHPDETAVRPGAVHDRCDVRETERLVEVEPHLRQLHGDVGIGPRGADAVEQIEVAVARLPRLLGA